VEGGASAQLATRASNATTAKIFVNFSGVFIAISIRV
jgi:hypothetical protein